MKFAQGLVVPTPAPPVSPLIATLSGASTIGPTLLPTTMSQLRVFPLAVLATMKLPVASTSMPRSEVLAMLPSMRLSDPVT